MNKTTQTNKSCRRQKRGLVLKICSWLSLVLSEKALLLQAAVIVGRRVMNKTAVNYIVAT